MDYPLAHSDSTPPPAPFNVKVTALPDKTVEITWDAEADFESGIKAFIVQRDGSDLAQVPEKPVGRFGRPLFQAMSFHDTPEKPLPQMRLIDKTAKPGAKHQYRVIAVNGTDLKSPPSMGADLPPFSLHLLNPRALYAAEGAIPVVQDPVDFQIISGFDHTVIARGGQ